jgi:hypothetical protein
MLVLLGRHCLCSACISVTLRQIPSGFLTGKNAFHHLLGDGLLP